MKLRRSARVAFYTVSMYVVTHLLAFSVLPIELIALAFDRNGLYREKFYHHKMRFADLLLKIVGRRVSVSGLNHCEQGKNYLIVANYPSFYTGFMLMKLFPKALLVVHAFMSRMPVLGHLLKRVGTIFVDSKGPRSAQQAIDRMLELHPGSSIIILPEGGRTTTGEIQRFKRGFIYILKHSSLDLLPVTLSGFYQLKPVNRKYLDPDAELEIIIHKSISNDTIRSMSDEDVIETTTEVIAESYRP